MIVLLLNDIQRIKSDYITTIVPFLVQQPQLCTIMYIYIELISNNVSIVAIKILCSTFAQAIISYQVITIRDLFQGWFLALSSPGLQYQLRDAG